jgi:hypothetical protein
MASVEGGTPYLTVRLSKDADLAAALLGSGGQHEAMLNKLASAADPSSGRRAALLIRADLAPAVTQDLERLASRAAEAGHPQAGAVAALAAQIRSHPHHP